jgi:hypothetical protein
MKLLTLDEATTTASQIIVPIAKVCGISSIQLDSTGVAIYSFLKFIQFQVSIPYNIREREGREGEEG